MCLQIPENPTSEGLLYGLGVMLEMSTVAVCTKIHGHNISSCIWAYWSPGPQNSSHGSTFATPSSSRWFLPPTGGDLGDPAGMYRG